MKRIGVTLCCILLVGVLFWFFPLFHIVHTNNAIPAEHETALNASAFAKTFWKTQLTPSLGQAPDAAAVLAALSASRESARTTFGRKVGVSRASLYVMRGSGIILSVDKKGVGIGLGNDAKQADVVLQTGLLFGNTVRDATGLLDTAKFPDSRQFNEISTELNRIVEADVVAVLKQNGAVGRHVTFAGCAEIPDHSELPHPLILIPLQVHID
jgi:predicted lipoprotein